jgi:hypothetical protein
VTGEPLSNTHYWGENQMTRPNVSRTGSAKSGGKPALEPCACCGISPDPRGRPFQITFSLPDVYYDIHPELLETWGDDPFLAIRDVGFYLRVIMPVKLTDGYAVDFGTWVKVDPEVFRDAWRTWNVPEYADLAFDARLANRMEPWQPTLLTIVKARVNDVDQVPYLVESPNELGARILTETWPHAEVLAPYAHMLKETPPIER